MSKKITSVLALLFVVCMIAPMAVFAEASTTYDVKVTISDKESAAGAKEDYELTGSLTIQSGSAKMVEVLAQIVLANYESLKNFKSEAMREIMDNGLAIAKPAGINLPSAWTTYVNGINFTGDATVVANLKNYDTTIETYGIGTYTVALTNTVAGDAKDNVTYTVKIEVSEHKVVPGGPGILDDEEISIPVSTDENEFSAEVSGELRDGEVKVSIGYDVINKVTESSKEKDIPTYITVDLSALDDDICAVTFDTAVFNYFAETGEGETNNVIGLQITMPDGTEATIDAAALKGISEQAKGNEISLVITMYEVAAETLNTRQQAALEDLDNPMVLEAFFICNGERIGDFKGGSVRLVASYPSESPARVYYLQDNGELERMSASFDGKKVSFVVKHFSHYVIENYDAESYEKCLQDSTCVYANFTDIDTTEWYHDGVHFCVEAGLMNGVATNVFSPNTNTTRGQIVTILYRLAGSPKVRTACPFKDVAAGSYYEDAITWAAANGVVEGYSADTFGPDDAITREQMAKILYFFETRYCGNTKWQKTAELNFPDAANVHDWAYEALCWANEKGIIRGLDTGKLDPQGTAIRVQAASMIQRYCAMN